MTIFDFTALRLFRKKAHLSQTEVAKAIGCSAATLTNWENGKTDVPVQKLKAMMILYGASPSDFIINKHNRKENESCLTPRIL